MSRPTTENIACPRCGHSQPFVVWQSLNVTLDPEEKQSLLDGRLTRFTCGSCGHSAGVSYPLLYHDMERQLMVWSIPSDRPGVPGELPDGLPAHMRRTMGDSYTFRRVYGQNALVEKILLAEAGLDDGVIEILKLTVRDRLPAERRTEDTSVYFGRLTSEGDGSPGRQVTFVILGPAGIGEVDVPLEPGYTTIVADFGERMRRAVRDLGDWPVVDAELATSVARGSIDVDGES